MSLPTRPRSMLTRPRHLLVDTALAMAQVLCRGHLIDGSPALGHAVKVARKLHEHHRSARPELLAALILHDSPEYAGGDTSTLTALLTERLNADVAHLVWAVNDAHETLERNASPDVHRIDREALAGIAADKVVAIAAITRRGRRSTDPAAFWAQRRPLLDRLPCFGAFTTAARPHLPPGLAAELDRIVGAAFRQTAHPGVGDLYAAAAGGQR